MPGNLFKAFFAWGNGLVRAGRRSQSNSSYAILGFSALIIREDASLPDSSQSGVLGGKDLFWSGSNVFLEVGESFSTTFVARQICDVFPDD
jgi:hypothetical protein